MKIILNRISEYDSAFDEMIRSAYAEEPIVLNAKKNTNGLGYLDGTRYNEWLSSDDYIYECETDDGVKIGGAVVGFVDEENASGIEIIDMFVLREYRDQGYGTSIFDNVQEIFKDADFITLKTPLQARKNHIFFVEKCGMRVVKMVGAKKIQDSFYVMRKNKPVATDGQENKGEKHD